MKNPYNNDMTVLFSHSTTRRLRAFALGLCFLGAAACGGADSTDPAASSISEVALSQASLTLGVGSSAALEVTIVDLSGNSSTPRNVFWSTSDATVARVSVAGVVTAVAPGTAQIAATVQGKSAVANLTVAPTAVASVQLSQAEARLTIGDRVQITARAVDAGGNTLSGRVIAWKSGDASIAAVDSTGRITALAPGGTTVTATSEGRVASLAVFVSTVPAASIALTPSSAALVEGQTTQLNAEVRSASGAVLTGRPVAWSSANPSIASVSSAGLVSGVSPGSTTITASSEGRTASASITVSARPVSAIIVSPSQLALTVGQTVRLSAQVTDGNGNVLSGRAVAFRSDNATIATVATDGTVTAIAAGSTTIVVTSEGRTASVNVVVSPVPIASIRITPDAAALAVGQTTTLAASALDAGGRVLNGRALSWSSGSPSVATVSQEGVVTAVGVGTVVVLAQAEGQTAFATITVRAAPIASVALAPSSNALTVGGSVDLTSTILDVNGATVFGRAVLFETSDANVATVSTNGRVTAVSPGTATITGSVDGKSGTASVTVAAVPIGTVTVSPPTASVAVGATTDLSATVRDANGATVTGRPVTWQSSSPSIATVSTTGRVTGVAPGSATITATVDGKIGASTITVTAAPVATVTVSPSSRSLTVGGTVALTAAVVDVNGAAVTGRTITWSTSNSNVATVSASGTVTAVAPGSATITGTVDGKSGSSAITVTAAPVAAVALSPSSQTLDIGGTLALTATVTDANGATVTGRTITWTSSNTNVATVNASGTVTAIAPGSATITGSLDGKSGTSAITVSAPQTLGIGRVQVTPSSADLFENGPTNRTIQLTATAYDAPTGGSVVNNAVFVWTSSAPLVATVSTTGRVTAVKEGTAIITASSGGRSATSTITVSKR